jgi:hypothetical protein
MRLIAFVIIILSSVSFDANCQVYYRNTEFGISAGGANYFGDLNQEYGFDYFRQSGGAFIKYNFSPYIALRLAGNYAHVGFADSYTQNFFQQQRNLSFKSDIYEASLMADFHFFKYDIGDFDNRYTPYISLGVGVFNYDPYAEIDDTRVRLRPLGTEGQSYPQFSDRKYTTTAVSFPIGAGIKFWLAKGMTVGFEVINRMTTTDYLDDVSATYVGADLFPNNSGSPYPTFASQLQDRSPEVTNTPIGIQGRQRGISSTRDQFLTAHLFISFRLPTYRCPDTR